MRYGVEKLQDLLNFDFHEREKKKEPEYYLKSVQVLEILCNNKAKILCTLRQKNICLYCQKPVGLNSEYIKDSICEQYFHRVCFKSDVLKQFPDLLEDNLRRFKCIKCSSTFDYDFIVEAIGIEEVLNAQEKQNFKMAQELQQQWDKEELENQTFQCFKCKEAKNIHRECRIIGECNHKMCESCLKKQVQNHYKTGILNCIECEYMKKSKDNQDKPKNPDEICRIETAIVQCFLPENQFLEYLAVVNSNYYKEQSKEGNCEFRQCPGFIKKGTQECIIEKEILKDIILYGKQPNYEIEKCPFQYSFDSRDGFTFYQCEVCQLEFCPQCSGYPHPGKTCEENKNLVQNILGNKSNILNQKQLLETAMNLCNGDIEQAENIVKSSNYSELLSLNQLLPCQKNALKYVADMAKKRSEACLQNQELRFQKLGYDKNQLNQTLKYIRDEAPITINFRLSLLSCFIKDKKYKNLFEVSPQSTGSRIGWERQLFGGHYDGAQAHERVKYGALNIFNDPAGLQSCLGYGQSFFVMKNVRLRTTFYDKDTGGFQNDSLATCQHYGHVLAKYSDKELTEVCQLATKQKFVSSSLNQGGNYKEVQIHGEVSFSENVEILFYSEEELQSYNNNRGHLAYARNRQNKENFDFQSIKDSIEQFSKTFNVPCIPILRDKQERKNQMGL